MRALLISISGIFSITAIITHIWTVIIAFTEAGFVGGIISLILPFLSELYWMIEMFGQNDVYAWVAFIHLILAIPVTMVGGD